VSKEQATVQPSLTWAKAGAGIIVLALSLVQPATAAAQALQQVTTITITDSGVTPPGPTVPSGGTVVWVNNGALVHTVTSQGQSPLPLDTGGIGPGQNTSLVLSTPGTYYYTSETDCMGGVAPTAFSCGPYAVIVSPTPASQAQAPAPPVALPTAAAPAPTPSQVTTSSAPATFATVTITDTGMTPDTVYLAVGGNVTFQNQSPTAVHTATSTVGGAFAPFDTGGLGPGGIVNIGFNQPATYTFTSAVDCLGGQRTPKFNCGPYNIIVSNSPPPAATAIPAAVAPSANTNISIDEANGFQPGNLTIKAGQTVTWTNKGGQVHSVVSEIVQTPIGLQPTVSGLDSGGLAPGQSFSFTFTTPGTFNYHSSTEPTYTQSKFANAVISYQYNGVITVLP
jgi:plastocyanin